MWCDAPRRMCRRISQRAAKLKTIKLISAYLLVHKSNCQGDAAILGAKIT